MRHVAARSFAWRPPGAIGLAIALVAALVMNACEASSDEMSGPLEGILRSHPGLERVLDAAHDHRLQVVLGLVEQGPAGPRLVQHGLRLGDEYFYPASSVKLFAAVAALERLAELRRETGLVIDQETPLVFHPLCGDEVLEDTDDSNLEGGHITVRHEIRKLFLVSDNRAFNRLYELVGQDRLAASLSRAGLTDARIVHRLSELRSAADNRRFPRIDFMRDGLLHTLPERTSEPLAAPPEVPRLLVGAGYMSGGEKIEEPMDFAVKNRIPLAELQRGLCMVVRPDVDCGGPGFALSEEDRALLLEPMSQYPGESANPVYEIAEYADDYVKFLLPGLQRVVAGNRVQIYNKVGQAYGFTTENAWVVDRPTGRGFFLAATLYTNADGVLNDDSYEYDRVALPFLADLGEAAARGVLGAGQRPGS